MKHLLLVAHGSRRQSSNDEVRRLADRLRCADNDFDVVACAFLEIAEPSIPDGLRKAIADGASEITVLPYFLSAGRHVVTDIPEEIAPVQQAHPGVSIKIAPYLGAAEGITDILLKQAAST